VTPKLSPRVRVALAAVVLLGAGALVARSPRARASFHAAYVGFRDPSRVHEGPNGPDDALPPSAPEIDQPELSSDFDKVNDADLADAGVDALSSLTLPDLPIPLTQRTLRFVAYFTAGEKGREAFSQRFRRAGRFRRFIEQSLRDAELPEDLLWLCAIESGFEPQAASPKGAVGLFQFMPETAARYGLLQAEAIDERRSIPRSTAAALQHLRDLFDLYGQWDLALAAYNLGHERLDEAILKLQQRRSPRDAKKPVELKDLAEARLIPKETANFVPQIQAFAIVAANRGRFGLDDLDPAPAFDFGEIAVPPGTPLRIVARAAGVSVAVLRDYNPGLLRDRTPLEGGDTLVSVPADRVGAALAGFPALYARENEKVAAANASASASAAAAAPPTASASAKAEAPPPVPATPASDRFTLSSGVVVERKPASEGELSVAARVEVVERGAVRAGSTFDAAVVTAPPSDPVGAMARSALAVHALAADGGEAAVLGRRRAGEGRRQRLAKAPYGSSWLALADRLFPPGSALAGTVPASPALPLTSVAIAEPPPSLANLLRITVIAGGPSARGPLAEAAERAFAGVLEPRAMVSVLPREERVTLTEAVPSPRVLFGWVLPSASEAERAALRLAILAIAHNEVGKVAHVLTAERRVAVHVRGFLDLGVRGSMVAIEAVPAVPHDVADVERELDAALAAFGEHGPTEVELAAAKAQHRARVQAEGARAGTTAEPREATLARLGRVSGQVEAVTAGELAVMVKRFLAPGHRVVVVTVPKG
jgi:membrane-bound lytic murein transglycosylase D